MVCPQQLGRRAVSETTLSNSEDAVGGQQSQDTPERASVDFRLLRQVFGRTGLIT
jgi:hypothetical protein